jgi:hypothetical protein
MRGKALPRSEVQRRGGAQVRERRPSDKQAQPQRAVDARGDFDVSTRAAAAAMRVVEFSKHAPRAERIALTDHVPRSSRTLLRSAARETCHERAGTLETLMGMIRCQARWMLTDRPASRH